MAYRHRETGLLEAELAYTPLRLRKAHLERLAILLPELLPERLYAYEYIFHRVTGFQTDVKELVAISGEELRRDLGLMLRTLSAETPSDTADPHDPALPLEEVAARCRVTPNTVKRWGMEGLPVGYHLAERGAALGVRASLLERFLAARREADRKSARRLTDSERRQALERAQRLMADGTPQPEVVRTLAAESGISLSSARRMLHGSAQSANDGAQAERERILRLYREGAPVREIARRLGRGEPGVHRALQRALYEEAISLKVNFIPSPDFTAPDAERLCLGEEGLSASLPRPAAPMTPAPEGLPPYLAELYTVPLLSRESEAELFRKYNYLKCRMAALQERLRETGYRTRLMERLNQLRQAAEQARTVLVRCNLRLVVSIAKRHAGPLANLLELISEGNVCLMRTVECYDYRREARFATYATWALSKHYARVVPEENYRLAAFVTGQQERLNATGDLGHMERERGELLEHVRAAISHAVGRLTARERAVIESHFGTDGRPARTLEEIGRTFGLTRERIRQIEAGALGKLRDMISPEIAEGLA